MVRFDPKSWLRKENGTVPWRRHGVAAIATVLLLGGVGFLIWPPHSAEGGQMESACWRIGVLMLAVWLAYGEFRRIPIYIWCTVPVAVLLIAVRPQWSIVVLRGVIFAAPLVIFLAWLWPRNKNRKT